MDMLYTPVQWIGFFFLYGFLGWCYESTYVSIKNKKWINRGFMRGPILPLYGSGAILLLFVTIPFRNNWILMFIAGAVGATVLEYITGVAMEAIFKVRYWDYTNRRFNFQGHICLAATTLWGVFAIIIVKLIHRPIEELMLRLPNSLVEIGVMVISILFVADYALSFKTALDIRDVIIKLEEVQREMERMQKRLDVILAFADDRKDQVITNTYEYLDELADSLEARFAHIKELKDKLDTKIETELIELSAELNEHREDWKEKSEKYKTELDEMRIQFRVTMEKRFQLLHRKDFFRRDMLRNNPMMISKQFKNALEDIKRAAKDKVNEVKSKIE